MSGSRLLNELIHRGRVRRAHRSGGCSLDDLRADLNYLRQVWNDVLTHGVAQRPYAALWDLNLPLKATRDLATPKLREIVTDHLLVYQRLRSFIERLC